MVIQGRTRCGPRGCENARSGGKQPSERLQRVPSSAPPAPRQGGQTRSGTAGPAHPRAAGGSRFQGRDHLVAAPRSQRSAQRAEPRSAGRPSPDGARRPGGIPVQSAVKRTAEPEPASCFLQTGKRALLHKAAGRAGLEVDPAVFAGPWHSRPPQRPLRQVGCATFSAVAAQPEWG